MIKTWVAFRRVFAGQHVAVAAAVTVAVVLVIAVRAPTFPVILGSGAAFVLIAARTARARRASR